MDSVDFVALGDFLLRLKAAGAVQISTPACQVVFMPPEPQDEGFPDMDLVARQPPEVLDDPLFVSRRENPFEAV